MNPRDERLLIVVTPHSAVHSDQLLQLRDVHPRVDIHFVTTAAEFVEVLPRCDAAVTSFPISPDLLAASPRLRWIQTMSVGVEHMLTPALAQSQVTLTASKGPLQAAMAEHVITLMLALARRLPDRLVNQQQGQWRRREVTLNPGIELVGKTMFVVGVGGVGNDVARMCKLGFQMRVLGMSRGQKASPFVDQMVSGAEFYRALGEADFVSLSVPLSDTTRGLIDAKALSAMKRSAYLLNVARGGIIDELALIEALEAGQIAGAGLDVTATEPLPESSPLWGLPNVIITPHVSAITDRLGDNFVAFWRDNVRRFADGEPLRGLVDKEAGY